MNKEWLKISLEEAQAELEIAKGKIMNLEPEDEAIAQQILSEVYIKLNYAWNSRNATNDELSKDYDERIKYPKIMDIYTNAK